MFRSRIPFNDGESLASLLYRLSNVNHYPSIFAMTSCIQITVPKLNNNEFSKHQLTLISKLSGINTDILCKTSHLQLQERLGEFYDKFIFKNKIKYCPLCIRQQSFHKHSWCLISLNLCMEHHTQLIDRCQGCGDWITLTTLMAGICNCGFTLHNAVCLFESNYNSLIAQSKLYTSVFGVDPPSLPFDLDLKNFINLVLHSYQLLDGLEGFVGSPGKLRVFHNASKRSRHNKDHYNAFNNAYWMYQDFPNLFVTVLDAFLQNTKTKIMYERKARFEELLETGEYDAITKAYESFWVAKVDQGLIRTDFSVFKKKPELLEQRKYISKDEIRTTVGMSYEKIEQLGKDNIIELNSSTQRTRKRYQIQRSSFNNVVHDWRDFITRGVAANILGIQRDSIPKLIKSGLLKTYNIGAGKYEQLSREEVKNLLEECRGIPKRKNVSGLKLHEALIKYSVNRLSIVEILQFTKKGELNPMIMSGGFTLADNVYLIQELEKCVELIKKRIAS